MKKSLLVAAVALGALFAGTSAMAADDSLTYNIAVTNDYVFRGISQVEGVNLPHHENGGALQGGLDYKNSAGTFYAGVWASNVKFLSDPKADLETDVYFGMTPTVGNWTFDFGVIGYIYPQSDTDTFWELKTAASHPMGKGTIGVASYWGSDTFSQPYYEINASYPIAPKWTVSGALGNNELGGYTTSNVGVTYGLTEHISVDLRYSAASHNPDRTILTLKSVF